MDVEVTLTRIVPIEHMTWFQFSDKLWVVMDMQNMPIPEIGTEMVAIYPNDKEVWIHWPVFGRIHPLKFRQRWFCLMP